MKKLKKILKKSYLLIGLLIFIFVVKDINFAEFRKSISDVNLFFFIAATILYLPDTFIKSYRWKKIMDIQNIHYSAKNAFLMYGAGLLMGLATPGKIGEFSRILYLKKDNYSVGKALLGNLLDKISDLIFVLIFFTGALFLLPSLPDISVDYRSLTKLSGLILFLISASGTFFYFKNKVKFYGFLSEVIKDIKRFKTKDTLTVFFLTAITWLICFSIIYLIAASIGLNHSVGFFYLAFSSILVILSALLPISVLGIGTREAALIFLLTPLGIPKETVILFSLLIMANYLGLFAVCFYCWIKKPLI